MERVKTGVEGLDKLMDGGIPVRSTVLVTGSCGTGKTILSLQYLYHGAKSGEPGVYVTFEETHEKIVDQAKSFGWDLLSLEKKGLLDIYVVDTSDMEEVLGRIKEKIQKIGAKRLVVDSLTTMSEHGTIFRSKISKDMSSYTKKEGFIFQGESFGVNRRDIYSIVGQINSLGVTSLLISEVAESSSYLSRDTISEFACDGVILLNTNAVGGEIERLISVRKLRGTEIRMTLSTMKFTKNGVVVEED